VHVGWNSVHVTSNLDVRVCEFVHPCSNGKQFFPLHSSLHADRFQYTYYTLTAFSVPIPQALKRSLTTMQIIQFLVGASYAALHSFTSYNIPVQVPTIKNAASVVNTAASSVAAAATSAGLGNVVKKYLFRAAGEEGLAENVPGASPSQHAHLKPSQHHGSVSNGGVQYHTEYQTVPCIASNGQTLAIWLNVFYLTPLTFLFVRFFVKSYITRTIGKAAAEKRRAVERAGSDALKGVDRELNGSANGAANGKANGHANGKAKANGKH
jgi:hypothetical protein